MLQAQRLNTLIEVANDTLMGAETKVIKLWHPVYNVDRAYIYMRFIELGGISDGTVILGYLDENNKFYNAEATKLKYNHQYKRYNRSYYPVRDSLLIHGNSSAIWEIDDVHPFMYAIKCNGTHADTTKIEVKYILKINKTSQHNTAKRTATNRGLHKRFYLMK